MNRAIPCAALLGCSMLLSSLATAAPIDLVREFANPILGIFGGADPAIPLEAIAAFEDALRVAGADHRIVIYDDAPHSFFDRKSADFADDSAKAWEETLTFVRGHVPNPVGR